MVRASAPLQLRIRARLHGVPSSAIQLKSAPVRHNSDVPRGRPLPPLPSLLHHHLPQHLIDAGLVSATRLLKPRQHIRVQPHCH